jgi:hypothetical protein
VYRVVCAATRVGAEDDVGIVAALSELDIGLRSSGEQLAAAWAVMDKLKSTGVVRSFSIRIVDVGSSRTMFIGWSRFLDSPSAELAVPVRSLTRDLQRIRDVMEN